jgi:hypothetical protein
MKSGRRNHLSRISDMSKGDDRGCFEKQKLVWRKENVREYGEDIQKKNNNNKEKVHRRK